MQSDFSPYSQNYFVNQDHGFESHTAKFPWEILVVIFLVGLVLYYLFFSSTHNTWQQAANRDPYATMSTTTTVLQPQSSGISLPRTPPLPPQTSSTESSRPPNCPPCALLASIPSVPAKDVIQTVSPSTILTSQGVFTGNPIDDTPLVLRENDVIGLYSVTSKKYLVMINVTTQSLLPNPTSVTTDEYDTAIEASADSCFGNVNAQWIVRAAHEFPGAAKLENVGKRGLFLKGFRFRLPGDTNTFGYQPGLEGNLDSCLYSTLSIYLQDSSKSSSIEIPDTYVIYPSTEAQRFVALDKDAAIYLAANANGTLADAGRAHAPEQILWQRIYVGRMGWDGKINYGGHT